MKNGLVPGKVDNYLWKRTDLVCEAYFTSDSFDQINGTFASELVIENNNNNKQRNV